MDTSLCELETDINRLATQQQQIQQQQQQRQFFLHGDVSDSAPGSSSNNAAETAKRKTWNVTASGGNSVVNSGNLSISNGGSSNIRNQWGPPKQPFSGNSDVTVNETPVVYNGEVRTYVPNTTNKPTPPSKPSGNFNSGSSSTNSSFRLHSNSDSQGNRLFSRPK